MQRGAGVGLPTDRSRYELHCDLCNELDDGVFRSGGTRAPSGMAHFFRDQPNVSANRIWVSSHADFLADSLLDVPAKNLSADLSGSHRNSHRPNQISHSI